MPVVRRIFRYPDGHDEQDRFDSGRESYGLGETTERDGFRWKGVQGRSLFGEAGLESEIVFVPEDEFASHRAEIKRLLDLADDYKLSKTDRDRIREVTRGNPSMGFEHPRGGELAERLTAALRAAEADSSPEQVQELKALIDERLAGSF